MSQYSDTAAYPKMSVNLQELSIQHHRTTTPQVQRRSDCSVFQRNTLSCTEHSLFFWPCSRPTGNNLLAHSCCFCCLGDRECFSDVCLNPILAFLLVARCTLVSPYKVDWRLHWNINFAKRYLIFSTISDALFRVCYQLFFMLCFCAPVCTVQYSLFQSSYPWVVKYIIIESAMWMLD